MKHALRAVTLLAALLPATALATYPDRPIRLMLPFPPGGPSDIVGRMFAQELGKSLGQQVVIDNRGGAAGNIACEIAKNAAPDGYTLLQGTVGTMSINPHLYKNLPYEPLRDFAPISLLTETPYLLVINPKVPANNVKELVALAKSQPGKLNFASGGVGTGNHFSGELFKSLAGIDIVHIPYKGSGVGQNDVLAGQVQMMFINLLPALPFVQQGRLRGLGVTSAKRSAAAPQIPTIAESGFPGYQSTSWHGFVAPAKTPAPIIKRLNAELVKITQQADVRQRMTGQGTDLIGSTPEEFRKMIQVESAKWANVIKSAGIKPE
ncbi:MAG: Bug family tripartite tricarboxylate transporter substrate binding protein [Betaproteobacteria bacterium]|nr:tripartite tricarboxylate transporter substrate binding protein [Betaproteobacteria bacterium]